MVKTDYLAFCLECGLPKKLPRHILEIYMHPESVCWFYCEHCGKKNYLPDYLMKIMDDL